MKKFSLDSTSKFFLAVIGIFAVGITLKELQSIFIPFIIAYFLFFLFSPLNHYLQKRKIPLFVIILFDLIVTIFITWGVSSFIIDSFMKFGAESPQYLEKLNKIVRSFSDTLGIKDPSLKYFSFQKLLSEIDYKALAGGIFSSTVNAMGSILFTLFFFIFIASGHDTIYEAIKKRYVLSKVKPELKKIKSDLHSSTDNAAQSDNAAIEIKLNLEREKKEQKLENTFRAINEQIQNYIIAKISLNLLAGILVSLILYLLGVDFFIIWGLFTFILNFIPSIGSAIALILPALMTLIQFDSLGYALLVTGAIAATQTLCFNLLEPIIIGNRLNLNPILILLSVLVWGYLWGIIGMLIAVPLTAIIKLIISNSDSKNMQFINNLMSKS